MITVCTNTGEQNVYKQSQQLYDIHLRRRTLNRSKTLRRSTNVYKMKLCILLMLGTLLVLVYGMPPISRDYNTHCRCLQVESRIIPPNSLKSIKLVPEGPHCPDMEVIAGLSNGEKVCLNPRSSWVKKLVNFVLEKQQGGVLPKNQAQ